MKTNTLTLFGFFFLCFSFCSWGQKSEKLDSLLLLYNDSQTKDTSRFKVTSELFTYYLYNNLGTAEEYLAEEKKLLQKLDSKKFLALHYKHIGNVFHVKEMNDSSAFYNKKALHLYQQLGDTLNSTYMKDNIAGIAYKKGEYKEAERIFIENAETYRKLSGESFDVAYCYEMLSRVCLDRGHYKRALEYSFKSIKIYNDLEEFGWKGQALYHLSNVENELKNYDKAIETALEARALSKADGDTYLTARADNNLSTFHYEIQQYDKAEEFVESALKIAKETSENDFIGDTYETLGKIKMEKGQYDEAISSFKKALLKHEEFSYALGIPRANMNLGEVYFKKGDLSQAIVHLNTAISSSSKLEADDFLAQSYQLRAHVFDKLNQKAAAFSDYKEYNTLSESILNTKKSQQIEEMRAIYDTEKKEQQIAQQETEISLLEEKEKVSRLQKIALGGGLGLSALALGFGFYGFRQRTKKNKLEKEKVDAELAFKKSELDFKRKELTTQALQLAKKNETLENLKQKANELKSSEVQNGYQQLITAINFDLQDDNNWENFARYFEEVHKDFNSNVAKKYPEVTPNELRLMALLKMNLSSKEIANILNISIPGIKKARQRLRKKMQLSSTDSLENAVLSI